MPDPEPQESDPTVPIIADTARCKRAVEAFLEDIRGGHSSEAYRYRYMAHAMGLLKPRVKELTELARKSRHETVQRIRAAMKEARAKARAKRTDGQEDSKL